MIYERQGVFTDAVKPVRMRYPFNINFGADIGNITKIFACIKLVENHPVINSVNFYLISIKTIIKFRTLFNKIGYAYRLYACKIARTIKIDPCFLIMRFYLKQNNIFRV